MSILSLARLRHFTPDYCKNAPGISSIVLYTSLLHGCEDSPIPGWEIEWTVNLTATLVTGVQEIYVEYANNAAGDNWAFLGRFTDTDTTVTVSDNDDYIGDDGPGATTTRYHKIRAWVVPIGLGTGSACSGPVTGPQEDRTDGESCAG